MVSIGPKIGITGESEYRLALRHIIAETKELNSEMDLMTAKFRENESSMSKNKQMFDMYKTQIGQTEKQLESFRDAMDKAKTKYEEAQAKQEKLNQDLEEAKKKYGENSKEVYDLEKAIQKQNGEVDRAGRAYEDWKGKVNECETELVNLNRKAEEAGNTLKHFGEDAVKIGEEISSVGEAMTKYITTPLVALGTAAVKASSDFTDGMAKIYTIAQEGQKPMAEMRAELEQLSADTAFSLDDLTEAAYQAVSASVKTEDAVQFVSDATRLARAGFTDTTMSVDLLTTAINAYGYEAKDAAKISDILLKTQNDGKTIVAELAGSMGTVIPTAAAYNVSLENLSAAYVVMTKKGINTARSTTFLNSMFTELERDSSTVSKTLIDKTGKSFAQLMGEGKTLGEVLQILYQSVGKDDEAFAKLWKNVRAGRGGLALVQGGTEAFNTALERINESAGQTAYALDVLETPSLKAKRAMNQLKVISVELGDTLIEKLYPTFEKLVGWIGNAAEAFMKMDDRTMNAIVTFGLVTAAVGPAVLAVGKLVTAVGKLSKWFSELSTMGSTVMIVTALAAAFVELGAAAWAMQEKREAQIEAEYGMSEAMQKSMSTMDELKKSHAEFVAGIDETRKAQAENTLVVEELARQYNGLVGEKGKVKKGNEELAEIILTKMAEALGVEKENVQKLIEKNGKFGESLEKNIEQIRKRAEMAAYEELYTEAIKRKTTAQAEYEKQEAEVAEQHRKTQRAQEEYDKALQAYNEHLSDGTAKTGGYEDALQDATSALATAKAAEDKMNGAISETKDALLEAERDTRIYGDKISGAVADSVNDSAEAIKNGQTANVNAAVGLQKAVTKAMLIDGDYLGKYADQGFANGMDNYSDLVKRAARRVANAAANTMRSTLSVDSPSKVMEEIGEFTGEGFVNGLASWIGRTTQVANDLANAATMTSNRMNRYASMGDTYNSKNISAPISVAVNVEGNADNYYALAESIAQRINEAIAIQEEVFA